MIKIKTEHLVTSALFCMCALAPSISSAKSVGYNPGYYHSEAWYQSHPNASDISFAKGNALASIEGESSKSTEIGYSHGHENYGGQHNQNYNHNTQPYQNHNYVHQDHYHNTQPYNDGYRNDAYRGYGGYGGYGGGGYGGTVYPYPDPSSQPGMGDDTNALYESYLKAGPEY